MIDNVLSSTPFNIGGEMAFLLLFLTVLTLPPPVGFRDPFINRYAPAKPARMKHAKKAKPTAVLALFAVTHVASLSQYPLEQHLWKSVSVIRIRIRIMRTHSRRQLYISKSISKSISISISISHTTDGMEG